MRIIYLHGFASSPRSSKARYFSEKFAAARIPFEAPELDRGDFKTLTITGMLEVVAECASQSIAPAVLMGSSLGGYLAALYAARHPEQVEKLVLLAPAFQFPRRWRERFAPEEWERWKTSGSLPFFHYAANQQQSLGYQFVEDGFQYEDEPGFSQPGLILHGSQDPVVPVDVSRHFAATHSNVRLKEFSSGHELTDVLDDLWRETTGFLSLVC